MSDDTEFDNDSLTLTSDPEHSHVEELPQDQEDLDPDRIEPAPPPPPQVVLPPVPHATEHIEITLPRRHSSLSSIGSGDVSPRIFVTKPDPEQQQQQVVWRTPTPSKKSQTLKARRPKQAKKKKVSSSGGVRDEKATLETHTYKLTYSKTLEIDSISPPPPRHTGSPLGRTRKRRGGQGRRRQPRSSRSASSTSRSSSRSCCSRGESSGATRKKSGKKK